MKPMFPRCQVCKAAALVHSPVYLLTRSTTQWHVAIWQLRLGSALQAHSRARRGPAHFVSHRNRFHAAARMQSQLSPHCPYLGIGSLFLFGSQQWGLLGLFRVVLLRFCFFSSFFRLPLSKDWEKQEVEVASVIPAGEGSWYRRGWVSIGRSGNDTNVEKIIWIAHMFT